VRVGGRFQWNNLPKYGKWIGGGLFALVSVGWPAINYVRLQNAETSAKIAEYKAREADKAGAVTKEEGRAGYKLLVEDVEALKAWKRDQEAAAVKKAAAKRRDQGRRPREVVAIPPPKPLPPSLPAALAEVKSAPPQGSPRGVDSGVQ
jgi:hypothetical protein